MNFTSLNQKHFLSVINDIELQFCKAHYSGLRLFEKKIYPMGLLKIYLQHSNTFTCKKKDKTQRNENRDK